MSQHNLRVALVWNGTVFSEKTFTQTSEPRVLVGDDPLNHFVVPGDLNSFVMFERSADGYWFRFQAGSELTATLGEEELDADALIADRLTRSVGENTYESPIGFDDWGIVHLGDVDIFFQLMERGEVVEGRGVSGRIEGPLIGTLLLAALLHAAVLLSAFMMFEADRDLRDIQNLDRFARIMVEDVAEPLEPEEDVPEDDSTAKKAGGEEGEFGAEDAVVEESKVPANEGELVDEIDVRHIGVNEALSSQVIGAGPLKNIFGDQQGFEAKMDVAMAGADGDLVAGRGQGGMSLRGTGDGGGGEDGFGRIYGIGRVDTGPGKGSGGRLAKKVRKRVQPVIEVGEPTGGDFCDPANIRRVVGAKQNAIKYCYEKELQTQPELAGKIIAQWKIGLDGAVIDPSIASSTMGDRKVEGCIARAIKRLRFEKPRGGICVVNYPFVFSGLE